DDVKGEARVSDFSDSEEIFFSEYSESPKFSEAGFGFRFFLLPVWRGELRFFLFLFMVGWRR
ncbi:hypothetical protein ACXWQ3_09515, partial [Streptococcus pyogenes]